MTALVSAETVLLVLLVILVAGLLRSHAEILRRLGAREGESLPPPPARAREGAAPAVSGSTPDGGAIALELAAGTPTLLAFLASGCTTCAGFWDALGERRLPGVRVLIVAHGEERESPARLRRLAPEAVPVVMSSRAWEDYGVPGSPYFVLVDGEIRGEGVATSWEALASLVSDARADEADAVERRLTAAGVGPGHPSLYPEQD